MAATVAAGLAIRALSDGSFAKYVGDALYTVLLYALCVLAIPRIRPLTATLAALGLSWAIEFLQLTPIPAELSRQSTLARLVLGSTFNPPDLLWYAVGAISALLVHTTVRRATRRTSHPFP
ncbi:DUF2809 domain-containing protein [Thermopolyspora sp. NPDC052614]|uniref:ribosomal maturation YjgA family protein n=1 Tax=Thermopolyspora sp. NPDC052614 TaxID=3155682 RepID=UPI003420805C